MAPATFAGRLFCIFYALFGIPLCLLTLKAIGDRINELLENLLILIRSKSQFRQDKSTKVKIMLAAIGLVLVLLLLGGLLYLSEDWSYFDGVYYCFIGICNLSNISLIGHNASRGVIYPYDDILLMIYPAFQT